jgi:lysophospholipase L1-like esterase
MPAWHRSHPPVSAVRSLLRLPPNFLPKGQTGLIIPRHMAAIAVLLLFLTTELSLRAYHQYTMRARLPTELRAETRAITWDEIGDKYRIVCFGDSITFGEDLPYEQSYPAVLANLLGQKHAGLDVTVINAGVGGHTAVRGLARLERDVLWYKPHVVVVAFGINDGHLGYWPLDPIRERRMRGELRLWERIDSLLRHSHVYLTLRGRTFRLLRRLGRRPRPIPINTEAEPQPRVSHGGFVMALEQLLDGIRGHGGAAVFLATMTPVAEAFQADLGPAQARQWAVYDEYNGVIRDVAAKDGAYLLDLNAIFENQASTNPASGQRRDRYSSLLTEDGVHLTPAGERLVAACVLQALEDAGLPGSDPYQRR